MLDRPPPCDCPSSSYTIPSEEHFPSKRNLTIATLRPPTALPRRSAPSRSKAPSHRRAESQNQTYMYFQHQPSGQSTAAKHGGHDTGPPGSTNGHLGNGTGGGGGWGRGPSFTPSGLPLPSPSGYPGGSGLLGNFPPPGHHPPGGPHHGHGGGHHGGASHHLHGGNNHHHPSGVGAHPHHPSFGSGSGMHLAAQNTGMGMGGHGGAPGFGMGYGGASNGGGSPPRASEPIPMTPFWQHQMLRAEASRLSSTPHHRARAAAVASRLTSKTNTAVTISDPNRPSSSAGTHLPNGAHKKALSMSVASVTDRSSTPDYSEVSTTPGMSNVDPANPATAPAPIPEEEGPSEPWTGLDLGGIRLKTLSTALFSFTHITQMFINHNALTSLPPAISQLRQLTLLDATANELTSLPPEIGVLCRLKELLVFDNHLTTLPPEMGTLYQLELLGVDGNPLEDRLKKIIAEEGTTALITQLRDSCPVGPSPPEREWLEIDADIDDPGVGKQESFTVLTYNILCASFAPPATYSYTPSWALDWNYRRQTILQEIVNASADAVCLQEIDVEVYQEFFYPQLKQHGYEGCHFPRTRARTMGPEEAKSVDGCATFWKDERFSLVETMVVDYNQVGLHRMDMRTDDMFNRVMSRDNIAVIAELEFVQSGARILLANSHIYWDHRYRDVKLVQMGLLMEELEKIADQFARLPLKLSNNPEYNNGKVPTYDQMERGRDIPLVLCVDLNSFSGSAVYDLLSNGEIAADHEDFMGHSYGPYTARGIKHRLGLRSSCASFGGMKMTNYTPTFEAAIDYIFYTPKSLKVTSVLGDVDRGYLEKVVGFPNAHFPSDHIPVFAQFRVKGKSQ